MSFSDSDLTELSSDDETPLLAAPVPGALVVPMGTGIAVRASTKDATAKSKGKTKSGLNPRLKAPRSPSYSISWLHGQLERSKIDVDPEYQRGVVWTEQKQRGLIDSLMHNYYIPPIVFSVTQEDDADVRVCIDGKQRLTAINLFVNGHIFYKDSSTSQKLWYKNLSGKRGKLISDTQRDRFDTTQIMCVEYDTLSVDDEREIFHRVQMGVALSPAERLKAINGWNADIVREMDRKIISEYRTHLHWKDAKGKDFLALARILHMIDEGFFSPTKVGTETTVSRIETFLSDKIRKDPTTKKTAALDVIDTLCCILQDPTLRKPFSNPDHKISQAEFVLACYMIHLHRATLSLKALSDAVVLMRESISHEDCRKPKAYKMLAEFVYKKVPLMFTGDKKGYPPAASVKLMLTLTDPPAAAGNCQADPPTPPIKRGTLTDPDVAPAKRSTPTDPATISAKRSIPADYTPASAKRRAKAVPAAALAKRGVLTNPPATSSAKRSSFTAPAVAQVKRSAPTSPPAVPEKRIPSPTAMVVDNPLKSSRSSTKRKRNQDTDACEADTEADQTPQKLKKPRVKQSRRNTIVESSDDENDKISQDPPPPRTPSARVAVMKGIAPKSSAATTKVKKRVPAKPKPTTPTATKPTPVLDRKLSAQTAVPSVRPPQSARVHNTTNAVASSSNLPNFHYSSSQKVPSPPSAAPTPPHKSPASSVSSTLSEPPATTPVNPLRPAPPVPQARAPSTPHTADTVKTEPRTSSPPMPSAHRLAAMRAAKQEVAKSADPRRRPAPNISPEDGERLLLKNLAAVSGIIGSCSSQSTPAIPTSNVQQQPPASNGIALAEPLAPAANIYQTPLASKDATTASSPRLLNHAAPISRYPQVLGRGRGIPPGSNPNSRRTPYASSVTYMPQPGRPPPVACPSPFPYNVGASPRVRQPSGVFGEPSTPVSPPHVPTQPRAHTTSVSPVRGPSEYPSASSPAGPSGQPQLGRDASGVGRGAPGIGRGLISTLRDWKPATSIKRGHLVTSIKIVLA